jgi:CHAT domain-containing protein
MFERQGISINHLSGEDAVLSKVCAEISHADVVHFAVHGLFDPQTPENSGVVLPLPHQRIDSDTPYLLHKGYIAPDRDPACVGQMLSLNYLWKNVTMFRCRLLNLSSCWTGMVDWSDRSDEFYGLANGFLYAGVQKILNCLWPVHDAASRQFNLLFYDALLKDDSHTAETLRRTVMKLRDYSIDGNKPFESPLFWANFRLVGFDKKRDPGVRLKY